jgi:hypothetical protein
MTLAFPNEIHCCCRSHQAGTVRRAIAGRAAYPRETGEEVFRSDASAVGS